MLRVKILITKSRIVVRSNIFFCTVSITKWDVKTHHIFKNNYEYLYEKMWSKPCIDPDMYTSVLNNQKKRTTVANAHWYAFHSKNETQLYDLSWKS